MPWRARNLGPLKRRLTGRDAHDPEGPLAQEMRDMRARKQPQKPLELPEMQRMRSMTQSKLPEELTEGAHESPFKLGE